MAQTRPPDIIRLAIPIAVIFFSWGFGTGALWVTRPLFAASFGVSLVYVGLVSSLSAAPRMVSGPITGFLADRWGRRPMIYAGAITQGSVLVLQFFSTSYLQYALLEVVAGLGIAFWTVGSGVLVADVTAVGNRGRSVAFRNTAQRGRPHRHRIRAPMGVHLHRFDEGAGNHHHAILHPRDKTRPR